MTRIRDIPIKSKLSAMILFTSVVALLLAVSAFIVYEVLTFRGERVKTLNTLADVLAENCVASLSFDDAEVANEVLSALAAEPNILGAVLYADDGKPLAIYHNGGEEFGLPSSPPPPGETVVRRKYLSVSRPVNLAGVQIGVIYLVSDTQQMSDRLSRYLQISAIVFLVCLLVAIFVSLFLQRLISDPVEELASAARKFTEGRDYSVRAKKRGEDELGLLTDAFNGMLTTIEERQEALQAAHDSLEGRVRKRTNQLRLANEELERSEETLRLAIDGAKIGIWNWDIVTSDLFFSERCREIFRLTQDEEVSYERFLEVLHPDDREPTNSAVEEALKNQSEYYAEYRCVGSDGATTWVEAMGRGFYDGEANPIRMRGVVIDITARKEADNALKNYADELERSNRELREFAYVASHDLKEPLRVVSSYCDLLGRRIADKLDEKGERYLGHITAAAGRMRRLISDLLDYSRVGTRAQPPAPVNLGDALDEALSNLHIAIRDSDAKIVRPEELPAILADRGQLVQLLQNLVGNALKFCKSKPRIEVSARRQPTFPHRWEIRISDNGPGIEPEFQDQIFKIFERLDSNREVEGTGIGLAICRRILERHGGDIQVESETGKGATFIFDFAGVSEDEGVVI